MDDDEPLPPVKVIHEGILRVSSLEYFRKWSTEELVRSLLTPGPEQFPCWRDGRVAQGNHRIYVLMERGYDVNKLERIIRDETFPGVL